MSFHNAKVIAENVSSETYRRQEHPIGHPEHVMSRSSLMDFMECPRRWRRGLQSDETEATEWGSLIDCLILTPERFSTDFAAAPETYVNEKGEEKEWNWNAKVCKAWRAKHDGATIIKSDMRARAYEAVASLKADSEIWGMLQRARKQVMAIADWEDKATGLKIPVKVLLDFAPTTRPFLKSLGDLKTGRSANPRKHAREVYDRWYDAQGALYLDVYTAATDEDRIEFIHVLQENFPPYEPAKYTLSDEFIQTGRAKYQAALRLYAHCLATNTWPGYRTDVVLSTGCSLIAPEPWMVQAAGEQLFNPPVERQEDRAEELAEVIP